MTFTLNDSLAQDHVDTMIATAEAARRTRLARQVARQNRRVERQMRKGSAPANRSGHGVGHAAARPFAAVHAWLVAGQL